jgi:hypothetical protein
MGLVTFSLTGGDGHGPDRQRTDPKRPRFGTGLQITSGRRPHWISSIG